MATTVLPTGYTTRLRFLMVSALGTGITGQTPLVVVKQRSDSQYWTGTAFQSGFIGITMTEEDSVNLPGSYYYDFNQTAAGGSPSEYLVRYVNSTSPNVALDEEQFIYLVQSTSLSPETNVRYVMSDNGVTLTIAAWIEVGGVRVTNFVSLAAVIDDSLGNLIVSLGTQSVQSVDGVFQFQTPSTTIQRNQPYVLAVTANNGSSNTSYNAGFVRV